MKLRHIFRGKSFWSDTDLKINIRSSMLSQLVTAAKGILFSDKDQHNSSQTTATGEESAPIGTNSNMVTTRRSAVQVVIPTENARENGSSELNGKRKPENSTSESQESEDSNNKRRKRNSITVTEEEVKDKEEDKEEAEPKKHFRFGSEEPGLPETEETEAPVDAQQEKQDDEAESSDDDAPEAVDNSAQLASLKSETQKREKAKQL